MVGCECSEMKINKQITAQNHRTGSCLYYQVLRVEINSTHHGVLTFLHKARIHTSDVTACSVLELVLYLILGSTPLHLFS